MQNDKKVLFSIKNLKHYFPVKGSKRLFVKANDGINLNIYEGETLGLVGESGCGKSTFGRVLLQLYHQSQGKTMYYGKKLEDISPKYYYKTIKSLKKRIELMRTNQKRCDEKKKVYEDAKKAKSSNNEKRLFDALEEYNKSKIVSENSMLDIATVVGGLIVHKNLQAVTDEYLKKYFAAKEIFKLNEKIAVLQLNNQGKAVENIEAKLNEIHAKKDTILLQLNKAEETLDMLRKEASGDSEFDEYEKHRDDGIDIARLGYSEMRMLRNDLQLIFQDPYSSLNPRMSVGQIIGEGLLAHRFFKSSNDKMQDYVMKVMEECGLSSYMIHRYPHQFSGGQRQRIGIARSLAVKPKFVVCDEAVSALDVSIQSQILNLLQDLKEKENLTYLFISHDLSVIKYISDRVGVMYLGNLVELSNSADLFANPLHPYTEALLAAIPTTDVDSKKEDAVLLEGSIPSPVNPPSGCKFHTRCQYCMDICKAVTPEMIEIEKDHFVACHLRKAAE